MDDAVGEGFGGEELEADGAVAGLNQGDAFADEDGDDVVAELVDFALVQKGGNDFAAAHHPDVFAGQGETAGHLNKRKANSEPRRPSKARQKPWHQGEMRS